MNDNKKLSVDAKGFSLIEILLALTLLGLTTTFIVTSLYSDYEKGQISATKIQINSFASRLKEYKRKCGLYPSTEQGLEALLSKPTTGRECRNYPPEGFIEAEEIHKDPWDEDFYYKSNGRTFNIWSYGPDQEEGGEERDADIFYKKEREE